MTYSHTLGYLYPGTSPISQINMAKYGETGKYPEITNYWPYYLAPLGRSRCVYNTRPCAQGLII